jgi:hypothetical protein
MTNGSVYSATEIGTVSLSALVKGDRRARFTGNVIVIMVWVIIQLLWYWVLPLCVRRLLVTASVAPSSPILVTLIMEVLSSSEKSALTRATRRNISEDDILHIHRRENLKSYIFPVLFSNHVSNFICPLHSSSYHSQEVATVVWVLQSALNLEKQRCIFIDIRIAWASTRAPKDPTRAFRWNQAPEALYIPLHKAQQKIGAVSGH